jgi:hypothetical protein
MNTVSDNLQGKSQGNILGTVECTASKSSEKGLDKHLFDLSEIENKLE